jgi:predicted histidine transporter YuiF (NhaC family)
MCAVRPLFCALTMLHGILLSAPCSLADTTSQLKEIENKEAETLQGAISAIQDPINQYRSADAVVVLLWLQFLAARRALSLNAFVALCCRRKRLYELEHEP